VGSLRIAIASDHAGHALKEPLKKSLAAMGAAVTDFGAYSKESVDYPDFGFKVAEAVASKEFERGILICGTGIGMSIAANKVKGIRAALCNSTEAARLSREHTDSNVLCLAGRFLDLGAAEEIVKAWLSTEFSGEERHKRRLDKVRRGEERWRG
jgi:ribose 5-phosphate isomerase B